MGSVIEMALIKDVTRLYAWRQGCVVRERRFGSKGRPQGGPPFFLISYPSLRDHVLLLTYLGVFIRILDFG